jgi:hypothetical protein
VFLRWTFLAYRNLLAFGIVGLKHSPGWAVGYFFIPLLNLIRPVDIFTEIWQASSPGSLDGSSTWKTTEVPGVIRGWWLAWIGYTIADRLSAMPEISTTNGLSIVAAVLVVIAGILAIQVVRKITARQEEKFRICTSSPVASD